MSEANDMRRTLSAPAYSMYYTFLFASYWFGSSRLDPQRDEDFNPEDVHAFLQDASVLQKNRRRSQRTSVRLSQGGGCMPEERHASSDNLQPAQPAGDWGADSMGVASSGFWASPSMGPAASTQAEAPEAPGGGAPPGRRVSLFHYLKARVSGVAEEDIVMTSLKTGQVLPLIVVAECTVCLLLWLVTAVLKSGPDFTMTMGGLDAIWEDQTRLAFSGRNCEDQRFQIYRWLTYQFTHLHLVHVISNVFLIIMLGIPMEGMHGHLRFLLMFNAGVIGGALCALVTETHTGVVGCSGGVYAILGMHFADLIMNWREKQFRFPTLILLVTLAVLDIWSGVAAADASSKTSHSAHVGGAISGLLMGVVIGRNLKERLHEKYLVRAAWLVALSLLVFCLTWNFTQPTGPRTIWEALAGEEGWCWFAQMLDLFVTPLAYRCIRCSTPQCVDAWLAFNATETPKIVQNFVDAGMPASTSTPAVFWTDFDVCQRVGWYYDER